MTILDKLLAFFGRGKLPPGVPRLPKRKAEPKKTVQYDPKLHRTPR